VVPTRVGPVTQVTGQLLDPQGNIVTSGRIVLTPQSFLVNIDALASASPTSIELNSSGDLEFQIVPGEYLCEFDPDPDDEDTPLPLKAGYFAATWVIPPTYQSAVTGKAGLLAYWRLNEPERRVWYLGSPGFTELGTTTVLFDDEEE
jgi:hypothetical protein